jgi:hypothetical protein
MVSFLSKKEQISVEEADKLIKIIKNKSN